MTDAATLPLADTSDMIGVHRVFREAFAAAPALVGSVLPGDVARAEVVGGYYANVLAFLHVHHDGEDELLWPRLIERAPDDAATIERIAGQHVAVVSALEGAETLLAGWRADPQIDSGAELAAALVTLNVELSAHLDEEERVILPLAARHLNVAEWGELPAHGMRNFAGDRLWLVVGLIQEQMTPEAIAAMEAHMPPPVHEFWLGTGRPMFQMFVAELRA